jgi:hypothetical protein
MMDGHLTWDGVVVEVWSTVEKPRLPGDGCGCTREVRWKGRLQCGDEYVVKLCEKHGREPGIVRYMLT